MTNWAESNIWYVVAGILGIVATFSSAIVQVYLRDSPSKRRIVRYAYSLGLAMTFYSIFMSGPRIGLTERLFPGISPVISLMISAFVAILVLGLMVLVTFHWVHWLSPGADFPPLSSAYKGQRSTVQEQIERVKKL